MTAEDAAFDAFVKHVIDTDVLYICETFPPGPLRTRYLEDSAQSAVHFARECLLSRAVNEVLHAAEL